MDGLLRQKYKPTFDINDFKKYIHKNVARLYLR